MSKIIIDFNTKVAILPEGLTGKQLKRTLDMNQIEFPHPKKRRRFTEEVKGLHKKLRAAIPKRLIAVH
jgi:hypothetical protein